MTASTASLLDELGVAVVETTTLLQTGAVVPDGCARTLAKLQSLGLDVVDLDWVDLEPGEEKSDNTVQQVRRE